MVICKGSCNAYYPRPDKGSDFICGSRRIRYFRGFVLVSPKDSTALRGSREKKSK